MYTIGQIQMLIAEYESKVEAVKLGILVLKKADGTAYKQEEAITRLSNFVKNWQQILVYHKRETLPYYNLCDKTKSQAKEPFKTWANEWRNGFCPLVGTYNGNVFNPTDNIIWDDQLITKYNAAITAVRKLEKEDITLQGALLWRYDGFTWTNNYVDEQFNILHGIQADNLTFGSGGELFQNLRVS